MDVTAIRKAKQMPPVKRIQLSSDYTEPLHLQLDHIWTIHRYDMNVSFKLLKAGVTKTFIFSAERQDILF